MNGTTINLQLNFKKPKQRTDAHEVSIKMKQKSEKTTTEINPQYRFKGYDIPRNCPKRLKPFAKQLRYGLSIEQVKKNMTSQNVGHRSDELIRILTLGGATGNAPKMILIFLLFFLFLSFSFLFSFFFQFWQVLIK